MALHLGLVYSFPMIEVKTENGVVQITFPVNGLSPNEVNEFVTWLRTEGIARHSKLTEQDSWQLSEEIKANWWDKN